MSNRTFQSTYDKNVYTWDHIVTLFPMPGYDGYVFTGLSSKVSRTGFGHMRLKVGSDVKTKTIHEYTLGSLPTTITTRIIAFLVANSDKPSIATVTGWGVDPKHTSGPGKQHGLVYTTSVEVTSVSRMAANSSSGHLKARASASYLILHFITLLSSICYVWSTWNGDADPLWISWTSL